MEPGTGMLLDLSAGTPPTEEPHASEVLRVGDLEIGLRDCDVLGIGSCSIVRAAVHTPSGEHVAVKIYQAWSRKDQDLER